MTRFERYVLRTTDVAPARAFYAGLLGHDALEAEPLPEPARARGAPPHWLGHLRVDDVGEVTRVARALEAHGATRLGPTLREGLDERVILRDVGGAVLAIGSARATVAGPTVAWHQLFASDLARTQASYRALFGWHPTDDLELGPLGLHHGFAWAAGAPSVGSMADLSRPFGVHPQWLFHFRAGPFEGGLDGALAFVRAAGGLVIGPTELPGGVRVAACEDPQGGAFALREG